MSEHWIRLLVKYKGKCAVCGKEIPQGEYALWSRASKAIKHVQCPEPAAAAVPAGGKEEQTAVASTVLVQELKCFICGASAGCPSCSFEQDCNRSVVSQACVCDRCMADKDAYENYQKAFLEKAKSSLAKLAGSKV
jgi:hypothetical protein